VLTVAHLDHAPEDCADANLKALCQVHHNRHDAANRRAGIRRWLRPRPVTGDLFEPADTMPASRSRGRPAWP
jgi:hypothetical protein